MAFRIDTHNFLLMKGLVPTTSPAVEVIRKRGEDGYIRRMIGVRTEPFTVETFGAYPTQVAARDALDTFADLTEQSSLLFEMDDINYGSNPAETHTVNVLGVALLEMDEKACIAGTNNRWLLRCRWTLILV